MSSIISDVWWHTCNSLKKLCLAVLEYSVVVFTTFKTSILVNQYIAVNILKLESESYCTNFFLSLMWYGLHNTRSYV